MIRRLQKEPKQKTPIILTDEEIFSAFKYLDLESDYKRKRFHSMTYHKEKNNDIPCTSSDKTIVSIGDKDA